MPQRVTRFAPSPTGGLHLGHAFSALLGWRRARETGGRFLLRIEDIDAGRCREEYVGGILADLGWLGIDWDGPVRRQSDHLTEYRDALDRLIGAGLAYPCFCSRADIAAAASAPHGTEGPVYPGTCREAADGRRRAATEPHAWRLDVAASLAQTGPLVWNDAFAGSVVADPHAGGDFVIARRDIGASYHLAVVVDDAAQAVTEVVRGRDLLAATHVQRLLQALLGLPTPNYCHHTLLTAPNGRRFAKRDGAVTLAALRASGADPAALAAKLNRLDPTVATIVCR